MLIPILILVLANISTNIKTNIYIGIRINTNISIDININIKINTNHNGIQDKRNRPLLERTATHQEILHAGKKKHAPNSKNETKNY